MKSLGISKALTKIIDDVQVDIEESKQNNHLPNFKINMKVLEKIKVAINEAKQLVETVTK